MELELPSAIRLTQACGLPPELAQQFTDVRECGAAFQKYFMDAWKEIENGNLKRLKELVEIMNKRASSEPSIKGSCLNVCALQLMTSLCKGEPVRFYMTLLAYAAVLGQTEMVKCLTDAGADIRMGNQLVGTPLAQMLVYCVHHKCSEKIDTETVAKLLDPTSVNAVYHYYIPTTSQDRSESTLLEFAIHLQRIDVVELLLQKGADIFATPSSNSPVVIYEYFEYGTTKVLSWFLDEYLSLKDVSAFIEKVLDADIVQESVVEMFKVGVKRHPAHAILTCGNQDIMEKFLARYPRQDLLDVEDPSGKTALQVAAEQNNLASVKILLKFMCQKKNESDLWNANDEYRQHIIQALLLAARCGYADIVKCILQADLTLLDDSISSTGHKLWMQAVIEGLESVYKAVYDLSQTFIITLIDENDSSTLGHKAAEMGNSELFKVVFPLRCLGSTTGQGMFIMLSTLNKSGLTPLQVAIKKNNLNILRTLQDYVEKQKSKTDSESCKEKDEWMTFWGEWGTKLLLYACLHGSLSSVKLLVEMGCQPDASSYEGKTPLSNAAKAGNFETVQYLLELSNTTATNNSALLMAAEYGHTRCVKILLEKGTLVNERCPDTNHNCLMKAIENEHRDTVLAILTHSFSALRCSNGTVTPMRMLIKHMPDVAEWVLNEYALVKEDRVTSNDDADYEIETDNQHRDTHQQIMEQHKFELLEDFHPPRDASDSLRMEMQEFSHASPGKSGDWMQQNYSTEIHPINLMVQLERENLLNHPLVRTLVRYKWWRAGIPGLFVYYFFYAFFLILLTALVVTLPTPGSSCTIFRTMIDLSTTNSMDRSVECKGGWEKFSCEFCIETDGYFTCYNLENNTNSEANAALTNLIEGIYFYHATAFIDGVPLLPIYDFFSTACQFDELGALSDPVDSQNCLSVPNGMVCYTGTTAGSVANYTCDNGNTIRTCRSDGRWDGEIPACASGSGPATETTFAIDLSTTNSSNRTVDCRTNQIGQFSCKFCIEINNRFTCYNLENSTSQSAANLVLTNNLGEETHFYHATASLNGVRMQPMINFFRTACQFDELGPSSDHVDSQNCVAVPNGKVCYNGITAGSVARYTCDRNDSESEMEYTRTCGSDGRWNGKIPACGLRCEKTVFFYLSGSIISLYSGLYLIFEAIQLIRRRKKYLVEYENYIQVIMFILILIFVFPYSGNDCWYHPHWRWQVGTVGVFLAWVNSFMLLKEAPFLGQPITMLLNVYSNFIRIIYLPVLLILTFSLPFYMIFFREEDRFQVDKNTSTSRILLTFANPFYSIWSVISNTFGGADGALFDNDSEDGYEWLSYSLFTLFLIAMPVLFNNFLIGIAVGETREQHEKASIIRIKNKVTYIFEIEDTIPYLRRLSLIKPEKLPNFRLSEDKQIKLRNESNKLTNEIKSKNHIKNVKWDVKRLQQQVASNEEELKELKVHVKELKQNVKRLAIAG